jgi:hypothetical protein
MSRLLVGAAAGLLVGFVAGVRATIRVFCAVAVKQR